MATVYLQPGSGTGTGTLADPYFQSQIATAETAAGTNGTVLFTDGSYSNVTFDAGIKYEAVNPQGAIMGDDTATGITLFTVGNTANNTALAWSIKNFKFYNTRFRFNKNQSGTSNVFSGNTVITTSTVTANYGGVGVYDIYAAGDGDLEFHYNSTLYRSVVGDTKPLRYFHNADAQNCTFAFLFADSTERVIDSTAFPSGMKNMIFYSNNVSAFPSGKSLNTKATFSCFFQCNTDNTASGTNINSDPLFVDNSIGDLRLRPSSPCINAGTAS